MLAYKLLVQLIVSVLLACVLLFAVGSVAAWRHACRDSAKAAPAAAAQQKARCG